MKFIYDRLESDLYNNTSKAYINTADLSRIEGNIDELSTRLGLGLKSVTNWSSTGIPRQTDSDRIISNVNAIAEYAKNEIGYIPPELPTTLNKATIYTFNAIERTLAEVDGLYHSARLDISYQGTDDSTNGIDESKIKWSPAQSQDGSGFTTVDMSDVFRCEMSITVDDEIVANNVYYYAPTANIVDTFEMSNTAGQSAVLWLCYDYATDKAYYTYTKYTGDIPDGYYENGKWWFSIGRIWLSTTKNGSLYDIDVDLVLLNLTSYGYALRRETGTLLSDRELNKWTKSK